jgi:hypothetical protein
LHERPVFRACCELEMTTHCRRLHDASGRTRRRRLAWNLTTSCCTSLMTTFDCGWTAVPTWHFCLLGPEHCSLRDVLCLAIFLSPYSIHSSIPEDGSKKLLRNI